MSEVGASRYFMGTTQEINFYSAALSTTARNLVEQYQSGKWGIALTPPGTGATEVARATAADGYSVFTTRYLERLSQSANVSLQATNNINLDFKGDTLNFTTANRSLTLTTGNQITTASAGGITTNGGEIALTGTNGINFGHAFTLNSNGGNITLNNATTLGANLTTNSGSGTTTFGSTINGTNNLTATAATISTNGAWGGTAALGAVSLTSTNGITLPTITAGSILARTTGATSDITLAAGRSLAASGTGNAITLAAGRNLINTSGSATPLVTPSGRWLVYSTNPASDTLGGMTSNFRRFSCAYATLGTCALNATLGTTMTLPGAGNGFAYSITPTLTATPTALAALTYGDAAPSLVGYGYGITGYLTGAAGEDSGTDSLGGSLIGTTTYAAESNIGTYNINYSSGTLTSALGYQFSYANNTSGITINQRALTVTTNPATKIFGSADPAFTGSNNLLAADIPLISWAYAPIGYSAAQGSYTIAATATDVGNRLANYIRTNNYGVFTVGSTAISQIPNQVVSSFSYTPIFTTTQTFILPAASPFGIGAGTFDSIGTFDSASSTTTTATEPPTTILTTINSNTPGSAPVPNPFITISPELRAWLDGEVGI